MNPVRGVHRLAVLTAAATLLLLFMGGLVASTGPGLAVRDWPLSFGRFFPPMVGGVLFVAVVLSVVAMAAVASLTLTLRASRFIGWHGVGRAPTGLGGHTFS